jgi:hypothetical protein
LVADPQPIPYADLTDPQTLNLYSYVRNNPLSRTDPDGHRCEDVAEFGRELTMSAPHPLVKLGGYLIIGAGIVGTALTNPEVRRSISDGLSRAGDYIAENGIGGGTPETGSMPKERTPTPKEEQARSEGGQPKANTNPYAGPVSNPVTVVDSKGKRYSCEDGRTNTGVEGWQVGPS